MGKTQLRKNWFAQCVFGVSLFILITIGSTSAQELCLLAPVSLDQRVTAVTLIVEARVSAVHSKEESGHLITLNELDVFKVFRGTLPSGSPLTLVTAGGTVGLKREKVTSAPVLTIG